MEDVAKIAAAKTDVSIVRGVDTHPNSCWRYYDIILQEMQKHATDYKALIPAATIIDIDAKRLRAIKAGLVIPPLPKGSPQPAPASTPPTSTDGSTSVSY